VGALQQRTTSPYKRREERAKNIKNSKQREENTEITAHTRNTNLLILYQAAVTACCFRNEDAPA
jgi:flagellin-like hook-associated protein FlgL